MRKTNSVLLQTRQKIVAYITRISRKDEDIEYHRRNEFWENLWKNVLIFYLLHHQLSTFCYVVIIIILPECLIEIINKSNCDSYLCK